MTVLLSSCLFHQCLLEEVAYEVSDQLQAGMLTPLSAAQRSHSITLHHVLRVPGPLTCTRYPVGSHVIIFLSLRPHFGRVYPLVTFWERVYERQLHFKLGKPLSVFILLLHLFDILNKYQILSWKLFSLSVLMALLSFLLDFWLTCGKFHVNHILMHYCNLFLKPFSENFWSILFGPRVLKFPFYALEWLFLSVVLGTPWACLLWNLSFSFRIFSWKKLLKMFPPITFSSLCLEFYFSATGASEWIL